MDELIRQMRHRLPHERYETILATLSAYEHHALSEAVADLLIRYALMRTPYLLNQYMYLMGSHRVSASSEAREPEFCCLF